MTEIIVEVSIFEKADRYTLWIGGLGEKSLRKGGAISDLKNRFEKDFKNVLIEYVQEGIAIARDQHIKNTQEAQLHFEKGMALIKGF